MERHKVKTESKEKVTYQTDDNIVVTIYGKPNYSVWAKKLIDVYDKMQVNRG